MKKYILPVLACAFAAMTSHADVILGFDVSGLSGTTTSLEADTINSVLDVGGTFNTLTRTGLTAASASAGYSSSNWNLTNTLDTSTKYVSFSLSPSDGNSITLTSFSLTTASASNSAPNTGIFGYSLNGGTVVLSPTYSNSTSGTSVVQTWDFTDFTITATDTVEFRWYIYGATSANNGTPTSGGTSRISNLTGDDVVLNGTIAAVPEPSQYGIVIAGFLGGMIFLRRRKRI